MKKNILIGILTLAAVFSQARVFSQSNSGGDSKVTIVIMENVLFSGITGTDEIDLLNKKIARVDAAVTDNNEKCDNADLEQKRLQLYASLKNRLVFEKKKLMSK